MFVAVDPHQSGHCCLHRTLTNKPAESFFNKFSTSVYSAIMADTIPASQPQRAMLPSEPKAITPPIETQRSLAVSAPKLTPRTVDPGVRSGHLNLDTFSPVNQNGSFAFDRTLRSGEVLKRTRKTKVHYHTTTSRDMSLTQHASSNGNLSSSSSVLIFSPSTSRPTKSGCSSKSVCQSSQL